MPQWPAGRAGDEHVPRRNPVHPEPNSNWNANTNDNVIYSFTTPTSVIGWITLDVYANLAATGGAANDVSSGAFAGYLKVFVDDVQIRSLRYHSLWATRALPLSMTASVARTAAQTSTNVKLKLDIGNGLAVYVNHTAVYVTQFGAPGTG